MGEPVRIWAVAVFARKRSIYSTSIDIHALAVRAFNKDEAVGIGIRTAKELYPQDEGYTDHQAVVCEVPQAFLCG